MLKIKESMNQYYFHYNNSFIEVKASSCKLALLTFLNEFTLTDDDNCEFKFLGKDYPKLLNEYGLEGIFNKKIIQDEIV